MSLPYDAKDLFLVASPDDLPSVNRFEDLTPGVWKMKGSDHFHLLVSDDKPLFHNGVWIGVMMVIVWSECVQIEPCVVPTMAGYEYVRISMKVSLDLTPKNERKS